ncbi:hypothetical protein SETIT_5G329000v2 [Setaria italica]|uniref:Uncharacterized protein n=1 Tax=Setaria italica TaxID=4555 RepID=A0A368RBG9_SETIT|nr:uncharacterized protein LOC101783793 isoform X1 [Setaria italica]RCV27493.1 hypothetical protein SETIT_5G329000v2 [Setaria italica]
MLAADQNRIRPKPIGPLSRPICVREDGGGAVRVSIPSLWSDRRRRLWTRPPPLTSGASHRGSSTAVPGAGGHRHPPPLPKHRRARVVVHSRPVGRGLGRSSLPPAAVAGGLLRAKTPPKPACAAAAAVRALTSGHRRLPQGCRRACRHAPLLPGASGHVRQPLLYGDEAARAGPQPVQDRCCWDHRRWIGRRRLGCKDAAAGCWGAGGSTPPLTQGRWRACRGRGCRRIVSRRATVAAGHCKVRTVPLLICEILMLISPSEVDGCFAGVGQDMFKGVAEDATATRTPGTASSP